MGGLAYAVSFTQYDKGQGVMVTRDARMKATVKVIVGRFSRAVS